MHQLVVENLVVAGLGGLLGVVLARLGAAAHLKPRESGRVLVVGSSFFHLTEKDDGGGRSCETASARVLQGAVGASARP